MITIFIYYIYFSIFMSFLLVIFFILFFVKLGFLSSLRYYLFRCVEEYEPCRDYGKIIVFVIICDVIQIYKLKF